MARKKNIIRFNKKALEEIPIPIGNERPVYHDDLVTGLSLRISKERTITFFVQKRDVNHRVIKTTVGRYPTVTIQQARDIATDLLRQIARGINPNNLKREAIGKKHITLRKVLNDYILSRGTNLEDSTIKGYKGAFKYLSDWVDKPLSDITRDMVEQRHRDITWGNVGFKASPTRANYVMRVVRALFNYAIGQYEDERSEPLFLHNPTQRITHNKAWNKEKRRQGIVKNYELRRWYEGVMHLPNHELNEKQPNSSEVCRDLFIFMLFTGLRRNEATTLKWENIDFNNHSLTIEDTKNHETHSLPLTDILLGILKRRKDDTNNPYIFQGLEPNSHIDTPKKQLEKARQITGIYFTNHDLRRTFITTAEGLEGIPPYSLKRLLNHKDPRDVTASYIITDMERLREPMQRITDELWSHING
jgi:integrase